MLEIPRPPFKVGEVLGMCRPIGVMPRVLGVGAELQEAERQYEERMATADIWQFDTAVAGVDDDEAALVSWAYDNKVVSKKGDARFFYDELKLAAPDDLCPNCMVRDASALDHYLPRESYPALSIQPSNLVPICTACNTIKLAHVAADAEHQFLHPYFDALGTEEWLGVEVREEPSAPLVYFVRRPQGWTDLLYARVSNHFDTYHLKRLLALKAAALLGNHRVAFETHFEDAPGGRGAEIVSREASRLARTYSARGRAPWAAAAFRAWAASAWFCDGGWRL